MVMFAQGRKYLCWIGEVVFVIMDCPLIYHDDRVLGDEEAFVPVIFDDIVVCAEFVDRTPSEGFLPSDVRRGRKLECRGQSQMRCVARPDMSP